MGLNACVPSCVIVIKFVNLKHIFCVFAMLKLSGYENNSNYSLVITVPEHSHKLLQSSRQLHEISAIIPGYG